MERTGIETNFGIVLTDVDGTLLASDHRPCPDSLATIREVVAAGVPFVLVSGRYPDALYPVQEQLGIHGPLVAYSGALALDGDGEVLLSRTLDLDRAIELKELAAAEFPELCCCGFGFHTWVVDDCLDPRVVREERVVHATCREEPLDIALADTQCLHKLLFMGEPDPIARVQERLSAAYPDLTVVLSSPHLCEVMAGGVSKAEGVRVMCEHYGVDVSRAVVFGDSFNDIEMLRAVPQSYAMANAPQGVKAQASHVTQYSNDENGLARELEGLLVR